jgi:hypothetical protein
MISALRFFLVSPIHSRYMLVAMAAVLGSGAVMLLADPEKGADVLGPLALLQMLAASSGFAVAARRGHMDLLLTAGPTRSIVAVTHLALSVVPGLVVWCTLGLLEMVAAKTLSPLAFTSGSVVAFVAISTLAWSWSVRLPRLTGGIAWLLGIATSMVGWSGGPVALAAAAGGTDLVTRALVAAVCPLVLLGRRLAGDDLVVAVPVLLLAAACTTGAVIDIVRMDVPLESAQ